MITGCTNGIGNVALMKLAELGADIILGCRDQEKSLLIKKKLDQLYPNQKFECIQIDLSNIDSIKTFATEVKKRVTKLDVLINNAGMCVT